MTTQIQLRRGTTSAHSVFTGAQGEITYDTDKKTIVAHDGVTVGGHRLAHELVIDVRRYGAVGDGVTDDTAAIQAAIDSYIPDNSDSVTTRAAAMRGGIKIVFPRGIYRITNTIFIGAYVTIEGETNAMFPQAPLTPEEQAQFANASIIYADFGPSMGFKPAIHATPFIISTTSASPSIVSQTIGARYQSLSEVPISGTDIDEGRINYVEGANIRNIAIIGKERIWAGIRWTAASNSEISNVSVRNSKHGVYAESNWESYVNGLKVFDFTGDAYSGQGNQHAVTLTGCWFHAGSSVLNGSRPRGVYASFFNGFALDGCAIDECWDAIVLETGAGATINSVHSERCKNVWLTTNNAWNVYGRGNHLINNTVDARNYTDSIIWDGNDCTVDIAVNASDTNLAGTFPGKTYLQGLNPNTGELTNLHYATLNRTSVTFTGMRKLANDQNTVNRLTGNIAFVDDEMRNLIAGRANGNRLNYENKIWGVSGVFVNEKTYFNGTATHYKVESADSIVFKRQTDNAVIGGYDITNARMVLPQDLRLVVTFGTPEGFVTGNIGWLCIDNANGRLFIKTTNNTATGWVER